MFWIGAEAFVPGRQYLLKLGTQTVSAAAEPNLRSPDLDTLESGPADRIALNGIVDCMLRLDRRWRSIETWTAGKRMGSS